MKTTACVFASSLLLLVSNPVTWETRADEFSTVFQLRNSIAADDHLLSTHIADRHQWELRTTASDILGQSLVNGERLHFPGGSGMRGFIESSTERSDALRSTLYSTNANRQAVKTASFNLLPTISLVGELSRDTSRISASGFSGNLDRERASVEAQWVVYSGGANWARIRKSRHIAEASEWNYLAAERQIFLTNSGVYLEAVSAQKLVNAISDTVRRLKRIRYSTKLQYKAGFSSKTDIAQIDAEIASVSIQLEQARTTLEQQRIIYRDLVGREAPRKLADPKVSHLIPKTRQAAVDRALQSNYTINAAVSSHYAALENSNEAKGQLLPKVTLFANGSTRDNTVLNTSMRDYDWSAGIRVNIPLVNFSDRSRFHETRANAIAADYRARDTHRLVRREVESSWTAYHSLRRQNQLLAKQAKAIRRSITGVEKQVEIGLRSIGDLLREEIQLTENEISRIRIQQDMKITALRLAAQFSDLSLDDISSNTKGT